MDDLQDLYQQLILDHNKSPRNQGKLVDSNRQAQGYNPLCGDKLQVYLHVEDDIVKDISFEGSGCAISTASASLMTQSVKGKTVAQARAMFDSFHQMLTEDSASESDESALGKLVVFSGVCKYPARVKCATLAWHTINAALGDASEQVTTE